ncbi:hypothetical protein K3495_g11543 [Podosphaera aphanis]|nr:hypothetical protein K3495_g11543 [Podosphaera aphanis]
MPSSKRYAQFYEEQRRKVKSRPNQRQYFGLKIPSELKFLNPKSLNGPLIGLSTLPRLKTSRWLPTLQLPSIDVKETCTTLSLLYALG